MTAGTGREPAIPVGGAAFGAEILHAEADAIARAAERLGAEFDRAVEILDRPGKLVVTGVGKSGHAARKVAATLTSVGSAAVFLHPAEAMHGDLGILDDGDPVIAFSNSGESEEVLVMLPAIQARGCPIVAIVGNRDSSLGRRATVVLDSSIEREACPLNLAPTASVVVAIAIGDALALALQRRRGLGAEDYARNHPGGRIGRRLTLRVRDLMAGRGQFAAVTASTPLIDVLSEISGFGFGAACVVDAEFRLLGIITDYDVRHALSREGSRAFELTAEQFMTRDPAVLLAEDDLAYDALQQMEGRPRPISVAPVVGEGRGCVGMIRVHDFVRAGL